jgi:hypothetical protein
MVIIVHKLLVDVVIVLTDCWRAIWHQPPVCRHGRPMPPR